MTDTNNTVAAPTAQPEQSQPAQSQAAQAVQEAARIATLGPQGFPPNATIEQARAALDALDGKELAALVAGLGVSGRSARDVLAAAGHKVVTVDEGPAESTYSSFADVPWDGIGLIITSPVFRPDADFIRTAQSRAIPVISEVELAWLLRCPTRATGRPAPWIGITGTNGKTSTTQMVSAVLTAARLKAPAVGNIGVPVSGAAVEPTNDALAVELSSFQLHFTEGLALDCAAITNIADDHLDWHHGIANYMFDKSKVFRGVTRALVYNADDPNVVQLAKQAVTGPDCVRIGFTLGEPSDGQIGVSDGWVCDRSALRSEQAHENLARVTDFVHLTEPDGTVYPHLLADALCAYALTRGMGVNSFTALQALKAFEPGGHRIQLVATEHTAQGDIRFVDDSKATNAHAAHASLSSFAPKSVVWIAGGLAKGSRFEDLVHDQAHTIKAAVIIGDDQEPMREAFASQAPDIPVTFIEPQPHETVMERAVQAAAQVAQPGDVVLMAPACASMDQFVSYADRGNKFAAAAQDWVKSHGA